jgi:hypothetical protein
VTLVDTPRRVSIWSILRESVRAWRRDFLYISLLAACIEAPIILVELSIAHTRGELPGADEGFSIGWGSLAVALSGMFAHYFLAAVIEMVEGVERHGHKRPTVVQLIRRLPWGRLIIADLVIGAAIVAGLFLLVVPGVLIATFTLITLPLINMERQPVVASIRRSVDLVRGHFRTSLAVWVVALVSTTTIEELVGELFEHFTHSQSGEYVAHLATEVIILPMGALPIVMLAFDLVADRVGRDAQPSH